MSIEQFLTNLVKEEGISKTIIQMKESLELKDNIKEHIKKNRFVLNEIKKYDSGYGFCMGMNLEFDWIEYSDGLRLIDNQYSNDIRDFIRARFETPIREIYEDFERRIENGEIDEDIDLLVYVNKNMEIVIMEQHFQITLTESEATDEEL